MKAPEGIDVITDGGGDKDTRNFSAFSVHEMIYTLNAVFFLPLDAYSTTSLFRCHFLSEFFLFSFLLWFSSFFLCPLASPQKKIILFLGYVVSFKYSPLDSSHRSKKSRYMYQVCEVHKQRLCHNFPVNSAF